LLAPVVGRCGRDPLSFDRTTLSSATQGQVLLKKTDVQMEGPVQDGFDTCRHIKSEDSTARIPVIFFSCAAENDSILQGLELGAVDYATKPVATPTTELDGVAQDCAVLACQGARELVTNPQGRRSQMKAYICCFIDVYLRRLFCGVVPYGRSHEK
jgi:CheY-like chemotaxis protein